MFQQPVEQEPSMSQRSEQQQNNNDPDAETQLNVMHQIWSKNLP
jgi:hypothetical protein